MRFCAIFAKESQKNRSAPTLRLVRTKLKSVSTKWRIGQHQIETYLLTL